MKKLHMIRHGQTEANARHIYCGWTNLPLTDEGIAELNELKKTVDYPDISDCTIYTSALIRTEQTLSVLYGDLPHIVEKNFNEMSFGDFEMKSYEELKEMPAYQAWISGDNEWNLTPNGESGEIMTRRALDAIAALTEDNVALFAHGGVISCVMQQFFPEEGRNRYQWQPTNGRGFTVWFENGKPIKYKEI